MWECRACGSDTPGDLSVCEMCGAERGYGKTGPPWECKDCGADNPGALSICDMCGTERDAGAGTDKHFQRLTA